MADNHSRGSSRAVLLAHGQSFSPKSWRICTDCQDILNNGEVDDETKLQITLLIGAHAGSTRKLNKVIGDVG